MEELAREPVNLTREDETGLNNIDSNVLDISI
jgi:hypothetical protein